MVNSRVVLQNGVGDSPSAELHRFVMEYRRLQGVLQTDQEASIRPLARGLDINNGLAVRQGPANHSTLWQQVRTRREAVKDNYGGFNIKAYDGLVIMTWLVKHATWIYNRSLRHADGQNSC